jgi:hypothetical protein
MVKEIHSTKKYHLIISWRCLKKRVVTLYFINHSGASKKQLKAFLNNIVITDNYMMNAITTKEPKIENFFEAGDGI